MRPLLLPALLLCATAWGQTTADYLKVRKQHGITRAAEVAALETVVGAKIVEIDVLVTGAFSNGKEATIVVERTDGSNLLVESAFLPEWAIAGNTRARMIVRASRASDTAPLTMKLLTIAPAAEIAKHDPVVKPTPKKIVIAAKPPANSRGNLRGEIGKTRNIGPKKDWNLPASDVIPIYAGFIKGQNRRLTNDQAYEIAEGIVGFSLQYGVDARLIMAMVMVESGFNPNATSRSGAQGLGQLMPGTARGLGVNNAYDTKENLYGTVKLVRGHLGNYAKKTGGQNFDALVLSLAAYNAGSGAVRRHGGVPPYRETQNYIQKVVALYKRFSGVG